MDLNEEVSNLRELLNRQINDHKQILRLLNHYLEKPISRHFMSQYDEQAFNELKTLFQEMKVRYGE